MFQKKQIIYSETLGVCVVDNIVSLAASKREKAVPYYVLKPVFVIYTGRASPGGTA